MRKTKDKIQIDDISDVFIAEKSKKEIVATYMFSSLSEKELSIEQINFEYFPDTEFSKKNKFMIIK